METKEVEMNQLFFDDTGEIKEIPVEETLDVTKVDYKKLDKVDLVRLCNEKDTAIKSYESERNDRQTRFNKEIEDMNNYYVARINELKSMIKYYDRKFNMIKNLIDLEKEDHNDTIQRPTKG